MSPLRRLLALTPLVRGGLGLAALASFGALAANIALMTAAPYLISKAALVTGFAEIAVVVTAVRTFAISRAVLRYVERYLTHLASLRILTHLRVWLYQAIEPLAPGGLTAHRSGDLLARAVADVDSLDELFVRAIVPPVAAAGAVAVACVTLGVLARGLGAVLLTFLLLAGIAVPLAARRRSRRPATLLVDTRGELHADLADHIQGLADLMATGREDMVQAKLRRHSSVIGREQRRLASVRGASAGAGAVLSGLAGLVLLALAIQLVRDGEIHGVFLAAVPLVGFAAFEGVQSLGDVFGQAEVSRAAAVRTFEVIGAAAAAVDPPEPLPAPRGPASS